MQPQPGPLRTIQKQHQHCYPNRDQQRLPTVARDYQQSFNAISTTTVLPGGGTTQSPCVGCLTRPQPPNRVTDLLTDLLEQDPPPNHLTDCFPQTLTDIGRVPGVADHREGFAIGEEEPRVYVNHQVTEIRQVLLQCAHQYRAYVCAARGAVWCGAAPWVGCKDSSLGVTARARIQSDRSRSSLNQHTTLCGAFHHHQHGRHAVRRCLGSWPK